MADLFTGLNIVSSVYRFIPALLVLFVVFGVLGFTKAFGGNKNLHALIAFCIAILFLLSPRSSVMLAFMTPWFVILFFFVIFVLIAFKTMGVSDDLILKALTNYKGIIWWVLAISIIIGLVGLSNVLGQSFLNERYGIQSQGESALSSPYSTSLGNQSTLIPGQATSGGTTFSSNVINTLFNKQVLGFLLIGIIGAFSVYFMAQSYK